jgi:hypothetical protein
MTTRKTEILGHDRMCYDFFHRTRSFPDWRLTNKEKGRIFCSLRLGLVGSSDDVLSTGVGAWAQFAHLALIMETGKSY